jgi:hypothetical protein
MIQNHMAIKWAIYRVNYIHYVMTKSGVMGVPFHATALPSPYPCSCLLAIVVFGVPYSFLLQSKERMATDYPSSSTLTPSKVSIGSCHAGTVMHHTNLLLGHASFVADMMFVHGYFLVSMGWDGQLLFWKLSPLPSPDQPRSQRPRARPEQPDLLDPVGGYKLGPSLVVEFLPILLRSMMGCGLVVAMANKLGGVTLAGYTRSC